MSSERVACGAIERWGGGVYCNDRRHGYSFIAATRTCTRQLAAGWEGLIEDAQAELDLTEGQLASTKAALDDLTAKMVQLRSEQHQARVEVEEAVEKAAEERQRADAGRGAVAEAQAALSVA